MSEKIIRAVVENIAPLTDSITQLIIKPDDYIDYVAGQYLQILLGDEVLSYSIANAPLGSRHYELHIRHSRDQLNNQLFMHLKTHGEVNIRLPYGECTLSHLAPTRPILFIAAGTGFAPVNAMIEQLLAGDDTRPFALFWAARSHSDLYMDEKVLHWQKHVDRFKYHSLLGDETKESLAEVVLANHAKDIGGWEIVLCGPFDMVYSTRDTLVNNGVLGSHLFSDAFSFEAK